MYLHSFFTKKSIPLNILLLICCLVLSHSSCSGQKTTPNEEVSSNTDSGFQPDKILVEGSCSNGLKDSSEADVDCGGNCPAKCAPFKACTATADCMTSYSEGGINYSDIRCDYKVVAYDPNKPVTFPKSICINEELVRDAAKAAIDQQTGGGSNAGAPNANIAPNGTQNTGTSSATPTTPSVAGTSGNSNNNNNSTATTTTTTTTSSQPDLCSNGQKDSGETDLDCGGNCAAKCPPFKDCATAADCMASFTQGGKTYSDIRCDDTVASFDPNKPVSLNKKMCINEMLFWESIQVAISLNVKYFPMREGKPSLSWESPYSRANCPDDAEIQEGSNDTRGSVMIPNIDLAHTNFACVIKFSEAYSNPPTCVITGIGFATPVEMTFKIHSVDKTFVEVKGQTNGGSGATLAFNYICL